MNYGKLYCASELNKKETGGAMLLMSSIAVAVYAAIRRHHAAPQLPLLLTIAIGRKP
jgi:hypothetical protein